MPQVEKRYAEALMGLTTENSAREQAKLNLEIVSTLYKDNLQFKKIIMDPRIDNKVKVDIINEILGDKNDNRMTSFYSLLMDKKRISLIEGIFKEYSKLCFEKNNEISMKIVTAMPLKDEEVSKLTEKYKAMYNADNVKVTIEEDKNLIGGIKVIIGNTVYDGSLQRRVKDMLN